MWSELFMGVDVFFLILTWSAILEPKMGLRTKQSSFIDSI